MMSIIFFVLSLMCLVWGSIGFIVMMLKDSADMATINISIATWYIAGGVLWIAGTHFAEALA